MQFSLWNILIFLFFSWKGFSVNSIAILGDSIGTGAISHPNLRFEQKQLEHILSGKTSIQPDANAVAWIRDQGIPFEKDPEARPSYLFPTSREFQGGPEWLFMHYWLQMSRLFVNTEKYSWGYFIGRALGVPGKNIYIAAENGAKARSAVNQARRVLNIDRGHLPEMIFMFYTGNDICGPNIGAITDPEDFKNQLEDGIEIILKHGIPHAKGTQIILVDPLAALQLVQSDFVLEKKVLAHNKNMTCKELQTTDLPRSYSPNMDGSDSNAFLLSLLVPKSPTVFCPNMFQAKNSNLLKEQRILLANHLRQYRQSISSIVSKYSQGNLSGFIFSHINQTGQIIFSGNEIAEDCFHLSYKGQLKVAQVILQELGFKRK